MRRIPRIITLVLVVAAPSAFAAQRDASARAARDVVALLEQRGLQEFAAEHAAAAGTFSAALHIPGVQLLVITTTHPAPEQMRGILASGDYRQAYIELQIAGAREGRVFVQDLRADGLRPESRDGEPFDVVSHGAARDVAYDGNWRRQQMTSDVYQETFARDAERYEDTLQVLAQSLRQPGAGQATATPAP